MTYARIENNAVAEYPVYEGDIRIAYSNVSFPTPFVAPEGYEIVVDAPQPAVDYTKNVSEGTPDWVGGVLTRQWVVTDATSEEIAERENGIREANKSTRNANLRMTDWTQIGDVPLTAQCKADFADYRQALRDVDLLNPVWPTIPAEDWA